MRLKSIKLVGFKSFVDSTVVPFPTNMTAIVGPNGCGKSNVIDAVRWVMGESSAKHLRGESMTDVIFNGSTHRQPVGKASIELLFDNSEGQLVGEFAAFSEISIKRQVTREGQSQYFLNGSKCRRRDVTDIFLGTGMGPRSYAIIEQGMISRLIESKPEELRVYLEEAAGISKYKERRRETENRMRRTQENLDRLSDIREELGKQLATLKRQASAAERYKEYKAEERKTAALLAAIDWNELSVAREEHVEQCASLEEGIERSVVEKATGQSKIEATRAELEETIEAFQTLQASYYQSGAEIAKYEQELKFEREKAERAAEQKLRISDDIRRSEERKRLLSEELEDRTLEVEEMAPELELLVEQQEVQLEEVDLAESRFQEWLQGNERLQETYAQARSDAESSQAQVSQLEARIQQYNDRLVSLNQEQAQLDEQRGALGDEHSDSELSEIDAQIDQVRAELEALEQKLLSRKAQLTELEEGISESRSKLGSNKAALSSLEAIQQDAKSVGGLEFQAFAKTHGLESLVDRIQIAPEWGGVAEAVLGGVLSAYLSQGASLSSSDLGQFSKESFAVFLTDAPTVAAVPGSLASKVTGFDVLNEQLNQYACVESLSVALQKQSALGAGQKIVTMDGFVVGRTSIRCLSTGDAGDGVVVRQAKIDQLSQLVAEGASSLQAQLEDRDELNEQLTELSSRVGQEKRKQEALAREHSQLSAKLSATRARQEQMLERKQRIEEDMLGITRELDADRASLEAVREAWQLAMELLDSMGEDRARHSEQRDVLREAIDQARDGQRDIQSRVHAVTLAKQKATDRLDVLRHTETDLQRSLEAMQASLSSLADEQSDIEKIEVLQSRLQDELVAHERDEKKLVVAREAQEGLQARLRELEVAREKGEAVLLDMRGKLENQRLQTQALEMEQAKKLERIVELGFDLEALSLELQDESQADSMSKDVLEQTLEKLANRVLRLGPINLAAVDEYETQSERKNYLDLQNDELVEALETLEGAIRKIDKETRARFKETYDRVNAGLQDLFPKIFGGGSAKLELTDSDLLETGVSIIARPPGKNNSTIHLLSGGEKALTALALIFSIFKLNPAPFCMLDEVDAPLDDANVGRFARLVKEMSSTVQFIYISHNKVSMEMADQLMGVTMHEPGVSRLVSVDIDAAARLAEA